MEKDQDFIHWYKKSAEEFKPVPPLDSWEEISKQLDIDEVWENLDRNLSRIEKNEKYCNYSKQAERFVFFAACLLLLFPVVTEKYSHYSTSKKNISIAIEEDYLTSSEADKQDSISSKIENAGSGISTGMNYTIVDKPATDNWVRAAHDSSHLNDTKGKKITLTSKSEHQKDQFSFSKNTRLPEDHLADSSGSNFKNAEKSADIESINSFGINLLYPPSALIINRKIFGKAKKESAGENLDEKPLCESNIPYRFAIGIHGTAKNHWLLNQTTYKGLSSEELNTTLPSFGKGLGISAVYNLKPRIVLQAELAYSEEGQHYNDYINGHYTKKTIDLQYINLAAIFKYRLSPLIGLSRASNASLLFGFYQSRLFRAEEIIEQKSKNIVNEYKPYDTGFLAGFEYEYALSKRMVATTGIRFKYGLTNIYAGDGMVPSSLNETRNGSVDLNISLLFLIPGK